MRDAGERGASRGLPVYDSAASLPRPVEEAFDLWRGRNLVRELALRDIRVRYKRSVLGIGWTMLGPLFQMLPLAFVFGTILKTQIANYPVFYLAGSLFWGFFSQTTMHAAQLSLEAEAMSRRIFVPRSVFVASSLAVGLTNLCLALVPFTVVVLVTGARPTASWLFLPAAILVGALFTAGVSLVVFALSARFADVRETWGALLQTLFFATPIIYPREALPEGLRALLRLNPLTHVVEVFRAPLYNGWLAGPGSLALSCAAAVVSLVLGWIFFTTWGSRHADPL